MSIAQFIGLMGFLLLVAFLFVGKVENGTTPAMELLSFPLAIIFTIGMLFLAGYLMSLV